MRIDLHKPLIKPCYIVSWFTISIAAQTLADIPHIFPPTYLKQKLHALTVLFVTDLRGKCEEHDRFLLEFSFIFIIISSIIILNCIASC